MAMTVAVMLSAFFAFVTGYGIGWIDGFKRGNNIGGK